mmetsp:Transcript_2697/g.10778  ORF Transcript_2697/g.10778 Transcript_2697/m.10778 type:complete len:277 (+) Transcript_2697:65-895(+)
MLKRVAQPRPTSGEAAAAVIAATPGEAASAAVAAWPARSTPTVPHQQSRRWYSSSCAERSFTACAREATTATAACARLASGARSRPKVTSASARPTTTSAKPGSLHPVACTRRLASPRSTEWRGSDVPACSQLVTPRRARRANASRTARPASSGSSSAASGGMESVKHASRTSTARVQAAADSESPPDLNSAASTAADTEPHALDTATSIALGRRDTVDAKPKPFPPAPSSSNGAPALRFVASPTANQSLPLGADGRFSTRTQSARPAAMVDRPLE